MIKVRFRNRGEIRMGSPYNHYDIKLSGEWIPELKSYDWQNIFTRSPDDRYLVLTSCETTSNIPGFYFVLIDSIKKYYVRSGVFSGCCEKLKWINNEVHWKAWSIEGNKSGTLQVNESALRKLCKISEK